jgi:hypothetical protein
MNAFAILATGALGPLAPLKDKVPSEDQIGAGWGLVVVFLLLVAVVTFLGFSLAKHLRKARENADAGVFGKGGSEQTRGGS